MPMRPCLEPTCTELTPTTRCNAHTRTRDQATLRAKRTLRPYSHTERQRRAQAVADHRAQHGDWCPGWHRPGHTATDLTADHVIAVAAGGTEHGELQVLCRSCNSTKQDR